MIVNDNEFLKLFCFISNTYFETQNPVYRDILSKMWVCLEKEARDKIPNSPFPFNNIQADFLQQLISEHNRVRFIKDFDFDLLTKKQEVKIKPKWWEIWKR